MNFKVPDMGRTILKFTKRDALNDSLAYWNTSNFFPNNPPIEKAFLYYNPSRVTAISLIRAYGFNSGRVKS